MRGQLPTINRSPNEPPRFCVPLARYSSGESNSRPALSRAAIVTTTPSSVTTL